MTENPGKTFMRETRHRRIQSPQSLGLPQPPLELPLPHNAQLIDLPRPDTLNIPPADLLTLVNRRETLRKYTDQALTLEELSFLLWCTQGVKEITRRPATLRTVPSAGARHPFESLVLVNRVGDLAPGLYRFAASKHALVAQDLSPEINERITQACGDQNQIRTSAATFLWMAVVERMTWRYPERGYRYMHLDAGHVCQNLYLAAEAIGCGACAIAAFDDDALNETLALDGEDCFVIYLASLGKRAS